MLCLSGPVSSVEQLDLLCFWNSTECVYVWRLRPGWKGAWGLLSFWEERLRHWLSWLMQWNFGEVYGLLFICLRNDDSSLQTFLCHSLYWLVGRLSGLLLNSYFSDPREFCLWACDLFLLMNLNAFWGSEDNSVFLPVYFVLWSSADCDMKENQIQLALLSVFSGQK